MKKTIIFLLIAVWFFNCTEKKKTIEFVTLQTSEFNASHFNKFAADMVGDSIKHAHDSCMGFTFDANAMLVQTQDTFFIGSIVNRQTLQIVDTIKSLGQTPDQLMKQFNVLSTPCYEKRMLHFPVKSIFDGKLLQVPNVDETLNAEINNAITTAGNAEIQTGSWIYLDLQQALKKILDTVTSPGGLQYKSNLLDTANMVLTALESITDISFIITTANDISQPLQNLLRTKPAALLPGSKFSIRLVYISNNKFQVALNGFFPAAGQFVKTVLK